MTTQPPDRLFRPVSPAAQAKGERVFCTAVALLLVLSEVFRSNIQNTLSFHSFIFLMIVGCQSFSCRQRQMIITSKI